MSENKRNMGFEFKEKCSDLSFYQCLVYYDSKTEKIHSLTKLVHSDITVGW